MRSAPRARFRIAWRRPAVDATLSGRVTEFSFSHDFRATPVMIDGTLYAPNGIGLVEAFDPATGKTVWVQQPFADEPGQALGLVLHRVEQPAFNNVQTHLRLWNKR